MESSFFVCYTLRLVTNLKNMENPTVCRKTLRFSHEPQKAHFLEGDLSKIYTMTFLSFLFKAMTDSYIFYTTNVFVKYMQDVLRT